MGWRAGDYAEPLHVHAFPLWKHRFVARCFPGRRVEFLREGAAVPQDGTLVLWGMAPLPPCTPSGMPVLRLEDGFLRSVGLGAELVRPVSWVVGPVGMYYDAPRPSELEHVLQHGEFGPDLLARARALRRQVLAAGLTKYNVGARAWRRPAQARRVVLVVGQVESDASLAGFEALLRGIPVVCHGQPFYAGWGLTRDLLPHPRRTRRLTLDQLVAAALLLYPLYLGEDGALVSAEQAVSELAAWKRRRGGPTRWWQAPWRMLLRRFIGVR